MYVANIRIGLHAIVLSHVRPELQACAARAIGCGMSETDPKQLIKIARENGSEEFAEPLIWDRVRDCAKRAIGP